MQYAALRTLILRRLGRYDTTRTGLDAALIAEIQQAEQRHEEEPPYLWFLESASSGLATVAGTPTVALPDNFISLHEDTVIQMTQGTSTVAIPQDPYEHNFAIYANSANGAPKRCSIVGSNLHFFPTPDAVYSFSFRYFAAQTKLGNSPGDSDETTWMANAAELLAYEAAAALAAVHVKDIQRATILEQKALMARRRLNRKNIAREEAHMNPTPED